MAVEFSVPWASPTNDKIILEIKTVRKRVLSCWNPNSLFNTINKKEKKTKEKVRREKERKRKKTYSSIFLVETIKSHLECASTVCFSYFT